MAMRFWPCNAWRASANAWLRAVWFAALQTRVLVRGLQSVFEFEEPLFGVGLFGCQLVGDGLLQGFELGFELLQSVALPGRLSSRRVRTNWTSAWAT